MTLSATLRIAALFMASLLATACAGSKQNMAALTPEGQPDTAMGQEMPVAGMPEAVDSAPIGVVEDGLADLVVEESWSAEEEVLDLPVRPGEVDSTRQSLRYSAAAPPRPSRDMPLLRGGKPASGTGTVRFGTTPDPLNDISYDVPMEVNEAVHRYLEYFQTRLRPTFSRYLIRSGRYIPGMRAIFREHGLPEDLVYISLIESGFNPYAYSRARAAGAWQFISSTGKLYGLRVDYWVDERRDVWLATHAAAAYFSDLYRRFGDWYLAMAAYNAGENRVSRALKRTGKSTFWELSLAYALPQETRDYVPKFIAAAMIAKSPEEYGFFVNMHEPAEVDTVTVTGPTDLAAVARAAEVSPDEIRFLNPHLRRGFTPPDKKPFTVNIPKGREQVFARNFPSIREAEHRLWAKKASSMGGGGTIRHRVRRGETLSTIARKYRTRVSRIQRANRMGRRTMIRVGQVLIVPTGSRYAAVSSGSHQIRHRVRRGESLWKIAARYNVRLRDLMSWNGLNTNSVLVPGQRLIIKIRGG